MEAVQVALSHSISAQNHIQLLTHAPPKYLNTDSPTNQNSHLSPQDHNQTVYVPQPSIIIKNPNDIKSFFEDPSDIEMDDFSLPKWPLQIKQSIWSIPSAFQHYHTPIKELPGIPLLIINDNPITPNIPINPLFPP